MRFGSVCSGIEAASVAFRPLGWEAAWLAEIEPFPCAVLAHHYPTIPNMSDMMNLPELIGGGLVEAPDLLCGGTPCQAFSVAGQRQSLADERGNLTLTFVEIANAIDEQRPGDECIVLWENVPGVLSTRDNAFGCFLARLAGETVPLEPAGKRWGNAGVVLGPRRAVAWRVLDAQFFGLAQRRKRVFVVASARDGFDPAAVLLEFDGVRRDSAPSREAGQDAAGGAGSGAAVGGEPISMAHTLRGEGFDASEEGTGRGTPLVPVSVALRGRDGGATAEVGDDCAFTLRAASGGGDKPHVLAFSCKDHGADAGELSPTLRAMGHGASHANAGGQVAVAVAFHHNAQACQLPGPERDTSISDSLTCSQQAAVAFAIQAGHAYTLEARAEVQAVASHMQVRRLTPIECERLMGSPDNYTAIPYRNKPAEKCPDGPRYKALGNSWAVPCVRWIGERIARQVAS